MEDRLRNLGTDCIDVLQLHTWTRAWNHDPTPLEILDKLKGEGKIRFFGISTPEHDQNSVVGLMKQGVLDTVQVSSNIFEQEPAAELLPVARKHDVGIIVRVAFDEGALTGKFSKDTKFAEGDFRNRYFAGDRLARTVERVEEVRKDLKDTGFDLAQVALKFVLAHSAVSTVIPGMRQVWQAEANTAVSDLRSLPDDLLGTLRRYNWRRAFWYEGK